MLSSGRSFYRRARNRLAVEWDISKWWHQMAPLRSSRSPPHERTALFCELMTTAATAKVEALMAGLLRLNGYRSTVLLEHPNRAIEKIFSSTVPNVEFVYLASAISDEQAACAEREAESILAHAPSLQALVGLERDGFRIGRNVQSFVLRQFRVGRLDDFDPRHREATRNLLARSLAVKGFIERMLDERPPDIAIFVERGYTPAGEVFDGCLLRGIDVVQWCGAPQSDCLIYRRYDLGSRGEHPLALSDATWHRLLDMRWTAEQDRNVIEHITSNYQSGAWYNRQQLQDGKTVLSPTDVIRSLGLDPAKKTAVIFCHILYDATFFYGESLFEDYEQWLIETVRAAIDNRQLNWVVKVHPVNVWRSRMDGAELVQLEASILQKHFGSLPDHVKLMPADTAINTFSLFEVADFGLTVRGTIGMELPCFGIPVVTAGTGRYSRRGFTIDPGTREEYLMLLARLQDMQRLDADTIRQARLHYFGALKLRPVPTRSFVFDYHADNRPGSPLKYNVFMTCRADDGLLGTEDFGRLIKWFGDRTQPELLAQDI